MWDVAFVVCHFIMKAIKSTANESCDKLFLFVVCSVSSLGVTFFFSLPSRGSAPKLLTRWLCISRHILFYCPEHRSRGFFLIPYEEGGVWGGRFFKKCDIVLRKKRCSKKKGQAHIKKSFYSFCLISLHNTLGQFCTEKFSFFVSVAVSATNNLPFFFSPSPFFSDTVSETVQKKALPFFLLLLSLLFLVRPQNTLGHGKYSFCFASPTPSQICTHARKKKLASKKNY